MIETLTTISEFILGFFFWAVAGIAIPAFLAGLAESFGPEGLKEDHDLIGVVFTGSLIFYVAGSAILTLKYVEILGRGYQMVV